MTSAELKHQTKLQEWAAQIQNCRSSGLPVRAWCRQEGINASTYYRWERELLTAADQAPCSAVPAVTFAELSYFDVLKLSGILFLTERMSPPSRLERRTLLHVR